MTRWPAVGLSSLSMSSPGPLVRFLAGTPALPNAPSDVGRLGRLARRVRLAKQTGLRFLNPAVPLEREIEVLGFFSRQSGVYDERWLRGRWEAAAVAGLIPEAWVTDPHFAFLKSPAAWAMARSPTPPAVGVAVAVAADREGFAVALGLCDALAAFEAEFFGHRQGGTSEVQWLVAQMGRPSRLSYRDEVRSALRDAGAVGPVEPHRWLEPYVGESSPYFYPFSPEEWRSFAIKTLNAAEDFDVALLLYADGWRGGGFANFAAAPPNPVDLQLELWALGYDWLGWWGGAGHYDLADGGGYTARLRPHLLAGRGGAQAGAPRLA